MEADFVPTRLKNQNSIFRMHIAKFRCFHSETENIWSDKKNELDRHINEILNEYPIEKKEEIIEDYSWDLEQYHIDFPDTHRKSLLISIFSFLETELNLICEDISEAILENKIKIYDFKGNGIERAHLFLTKFAKFDWSKLSEEWAYIKNVNLLRNKIVHCAGELPTEITHKLNKFILKNSNLSGEPGYYVSIKGDFIVEFLGILKHFFEKLNVEIQKFIEHVSFFIEPIQK